MNKACICKISATYSVKPVIWGLEREGFMCIVLLQLYYDFLIVVSGLFPSREEHNYYAMCINFLIKFWLLATVYGH